MVGVVAGKSSENDILKKVYPVGAIYMSLTDTNPSLLFGGVWEQIKDRFLFGVGDSYKTSGLIDGEKEHTLTKDELPSHSHNIGYRNNSSLGIGDARFTITSGSANAFISRHRYNNGNTDIKPTDSNAIIAMSVGNNKAHNNMPPLLSVYIWKRVE